MRGHVHLRSSTAVSTAPAFFLEARRPAVSNSKYFCRHIMRSNNWCGECNGSSVSAAAGSRQHQWQHQRHLLTWFSAWQRFAESCASVLVLGAAGAGASVGVCVETAAVDAASNSSPEYWLLSASPSDAPNSCSCATRVHTNALDAGCSSAGVWSCNRCDQSYLVVFAVVLCIYRCFGLLAVAPLVHQLHFCECRVRRDRFLVHIAQRIKRCHA